MLDIYKENEKLFKSLEKNDYLKNDNQNNIYNNKNIFLNNNIKIIQEISFYIIHSNYRKLNISINNRYSSIRSKDKNNNHRNLMPGINNYNKKKKEINNLKEEIQSVKNEISNIMLNSLNTYENYNYISIPNKDINTFNIKNNDNIITSRTYISQDNNDENLHKKINNLQKNLKKEKNRFINLEKENISLKQKIKDLMNKIEKDLNNNIFTPNFFIKLFYNINSKIFSSSELKKYYKIYNTSDINTIFEIFIESCECLKKQLFDINFEIDSPNSDIEENYVNSKTVAIDSSYRLVNEKILKLKKLEFDFINLSEFVKNYLVSQEIIVNIIFNSDNEVIQFEPIEKLFNLFEECLNFKIDEMNDNVILYRKLLIKIFKNQKNCLGLSLESISQE